MSTSLTWTGALDTDLGNELNWNPADAPTSSDIISFNTVSNGGTLTGSASALEFAFNEPGPWVLNGATLTIAGESGSGLPFAGGFNTNVTLTTATLNAAGGTTYIGDTGGATVTANSGSTITTEGDAIGTNAGQSGSLMLSDSGTTWTEQENDGSGGFLTVGGDGPTGSVGGSTGLLLVSNNASLVTQASATLGLDSGSQGFGTLASGGVWSTNGLNVGQSGAGTLTINSGGTLLNGGTFSAIGQNAGSSGELVINADGTYVSTLAPQSNGFVLDIGDNGASGNLAAANGTALVTGTSATLNLNGNPLAVGLNGGAGSLTISNGGTAEVGTANSNNNSALSVGKLGSGTVTVTGDGSSLTAAGGSYIGRGGSGTLAVENDGIAQFGTDPTGSGGLSIGAGSTSAGQPTGGSGTAIVNSGGSLYSAQNINVGGAGVSGALDIDAGTVEAGTRVLVGNAAVVSGTTEVGSGVININAGGTLDIQGNGITASGTAALSIGTYIGSTLAGGGSGTVNVIGAGAVLNTGSNYINIGNSGTGEMTVGQGGSVLSGLQFSGDAAALIGNHSDAQGLLTVTDAGSVFHAQGQMDVGVSGDGSLLIENGGSVITGNNTIFSRGGFVIGWDSGSSGEVTVTGTGSELTNTGQFEVGGNGNSGTAQAGGTATLLIEAGGTVTTNLPSSGYTGPAADIAADPGTDGSSATVTGTNSTWNVGGTLVVGDAAAGSLGVSAGGTVDAANLVIGNQSGASGDVSVSGASILNVSSNIAVGGQSAGYLHLNNGASLQAQNITIGGSTASGIGELDAESGSTLSVTGTLSVGGTGAGVLILGSNVDGYASVLQIGANGIENDVNDPFGTGTTYNDGTVNKTGTDTDTDTLLENSGSIIVNAGADYTLNAHTITYDGTYTVHTGVFQLDDGATFTLNAGTIDNSQTIEFNNTGSLAQLNIGTISGFGAVIGDFDADAEITVVGSTIASVQPVTVSGTTVALQLFNGSDHLIGELNVSSSLTPTELGELETVNADGGLGALPCFAAGTLIRTERGEVAVEALRPGELVRVVGADEAWAPVVWVGRRRVDCRHHPRPRAVWPVRVAAGAFGAERPGRDLWLSPDHALFLEGVLIPVKYLIDGAAIVQVARETVTYYHVELPRHAVLLAEGLAAESYLEAGDRGNFANGGGVVALYPDFAALRWEAQGCAPLVVTGPQVEAARAMLAERRRWAA